MIPTQTKSICLSDKCFFVVTVNYSLNATSISVYCKGVDTFVSISFTQKQSKTN